MKLLIALLLIAGIVGLAYTHQTPKPAAALPTLTTGSNVLGPGTAAMAWSACVVSHDYVKLELAAPASAKFPDCTKIQPATHDNGQWTFSGYVDSQNGFGAMLRTPYTIVLAGRIVGKDISWTLVNLEIKP